MATINMTRDFADFLRQPGVIIYLDEIANDAQSAIDIAKSNLAYKGLKYYPPKLVSEYKLDLKALISAEARFNVEYTKVGSGIAKNLDAFSKTYHTYLLNLEILESQNGDHSALVDADLGLRLAVFMILINEVSPLGARYKKLNDKTTVLIAELDKVIKLCRDKALKAAFTLPLTILASVVCPQRQLVRLAWRGGIAVTQGVINVTYSSGGGAKKIAAGTAVASTAFGLSQNLSRVEPTMLTALNAAVLSIGSNGVGLGMEVAKIKKLQTEIKAYLVMFKAVTKAFGKQTKGVMAVVKKAEKAHTQALRNLGGVKMKTSQRNKLIDEIKTWNQ